MAKITLKGTPLNTTGELPKVGSKAPDFRLVSGDMADKSLADFAGKKKLLNIFPSVETPVCAQSARQFNEKAAAHPNTVMLMISADLPFASKRFCEAEGIEGVVHLSMMRDKSFGKDYGVMIAEGGMEGLCARAVLVLDENDQVIHQQLVSEIAEEPDYDAALKALA